MWNCLGAAGASQAHGHAQVLISKGMSYAKVEMLRRVSQRYHAARGADYFEDLCRVHGSIGLAVQSNDVKILVYLTPVKEKEVIIVSRASPAESDDAKEAIYRTLRCYVDQLGVTSFNFTISMPPLGSRNDLPYVCRIVDRGSIFKRTADIGGMELYGSSVIATDPYRVVRALTGHPSESNS